MWTGGPASHVRGTACPPKPRGSQHSARGGRGQNCPLWGLRAGSGRRPHLSTLTGQELQGSWNMQPSQGPGEGPELETWPRRDLGLSDQGLPWEMLCLQPRGGPVLVINRDVNR